MSIALACVAFLSNCDLNAVFLCLVSDHIHKLAMWQHHEILIVALADIDFLLPLLVGADDKAPQVRGIC